MRRSAFSLAELLVAMAIMGVLVAGLSQILFHHRQYLRIAQRRVVAACELANAMERVLARPWEAVTPDLQSELTLSEAGEAHLRDAHLTLGIEAAGPSAKRIHLALDWLEAGDQRVEAIRLTAWKHAGLGDDK